MSGKPKQTGWGGKRTGAGRPKQQKTVSEKVKKQWVEAAKSFKKKYGMTVEEAALEMLMDPDEQGSVKASILKTYNEALIVKETASTQDVNVNKTEGPVIGLPPMEADPALKVVEGGKSPDKKQKKASGKK